MDNTKLLYKVKFAWDEKYILFFTEKLNVDNDISAKKMGRRIAKLHNAEFYQILAYRPYKNIAEHI
jgi:hypothetical protein